MATKKSDAAAKEVPVKDDAALEEEVNNKQQQANAGAEIEAQRKMIEQLRKENEELKKNSVYSPDPRGAASDYERVQQACKMAAEEHNDPWGIKISVLAPRIGKNEDSYWLSVNGKNMQVPANDRYYELALPFAECLTNEIESRKHAADYMDTIKVYDPIENPHPVEKPV